MFADSLQRVNYLIEYGETTWRNIMELNTRSKGKYTILHTGKSTAVSCDSERVRGALTELMDRNVKHICVDLSSECIIDSSVIGALVEYHVKLNKTGGDIVILSPRSHVLQALFRMQIDQVIRFVDSESQL